MRSLLLAPHVALAAAGVPVASILEPDVLDRVGLRAALAYLRVAVTPTAVRGADLVEVQRRPSRALPPWIDKWLSRCRDVASVAAAADRIDDRGVAEKLRLLHADLERLANIADEGTTRDVLTAVRDDIGLGRAMTLLDGGRGGDGSSHLDDLEGGVVRPRVVRGDAEPDVGVLKARDAAPRARGRLHLEERGPHSWPRPS